MSDETYMGYANRETWAFVLHINNDQGLYNDVREWVADRFRDAETDGIREVSDQYIGESVVEYLRNELPELSPELWENMREDVGSFWRIDYAEVGANVREMIENG